MIKDKNTIQFTSEEFRNQAKTFSLLNQQLYWICFVLLYVIKSFLQNLLKSE